MQQQIFDTQAMLRSTQKEQKNTLVGLQALKQQITKREQLVKTLAREVAALDRTLQLEEARKSQLEEKIIALREAYRETLQRAYLLKKTQHPMIYILSAENLNQGFRRWAYLKQLDRYEKSQMENYLSAKDSLELAMLGISGKKKEKSELLDIQEEQRSEIAAELRSIEQAAGQLRSREKELRGTLERKKKESARLNEEIEKLIASEMDRTDDAASLPNAPAMVALSREFTANRGKLPWPVRKGVITGKFGDQPHPVLKSIKVRNNGIDISSEQGAPVQAVFGGRVVGTREIPGFDIMLIIQHGNYYSVYSRLGEVFVKKGESVETGQSIGRLSFPRSEPLSTLHFEIWEGKKQLNPESWLTR